MAVSQQDFETLVAEIQRLNEKVDGLATELHETQDTLRRLIDEAGLADSEPDPIEENFIEGFREGRQ